MARLLSRKPMKWDSTLAKLFVAGSDGTPPFVGKGSSCQAGLAPTAAAADLVVIGGVSRSAGKL